MKWIDTDSIIDISRGPETAEEIAEAMDMWKALRHLTTCASEGTFDGSHYGVQIAVRGPVFRASYWANEFSSNYGEAGYGTDPVEAMRNMHDCTGKGCDNDKHRADLETRWVQMQ